MNNPEVTILYLEKLFYAQHLLFPDILTLVKDASNKNNRFTLSFNPSLEQLSF